MAYGSSWRSKKHDLDPRDVVEEAARAAGMSVEEWLETAAETTLDQSHSRARRKNRNNDDDDESPLSRLAKRIERRDGRMRDDSGRDYNGKGIGLSEDRVSKIVSDAVESFQDSLRANEERVASALEAMSRAEQVDQLANQVRAVAAENERVQQQLKSVQTAAPAVDYSALSRQLEGRIENILNNLEAKSQAPVPQAMAPQFVPQQVLPSVQQVLPSAPQAPTVQIIERQNRDLRSSAAINAALAKVNAALRGLNQEPQQNEILKTLRSLDQRLSGLEKAPQHNPEMIGQMIGEMAALQQHMAAQRPAADLSAVNKHMLSLGDRIDVLTRKVGSQPQQSTQMAKQFSSQFEALTQEISELRSSLNTPAPTPDLGIETLRHQMSSMGEHLGELTQKIAALRLASVENQAPQKSLEGDLNELKHLIQSSQTPVHDERVLKAVQALENKIAAAAREPTALMDRLDHIQAMMGEKPVATLPPHVETMLQGLASRLQNFEDAPQDDAAFARLHQEIQLISRKLEQAQSNQLHPVATDVSGLERAISTILQQVDGLKSDMGSLAESAAKRATQDALNQISMPAQAMSQPDLSGVEQSIQGLFRQIDGWKSDMAMVAEDAAKRATKEALSQFSMPVQAMSQPDLSGVEQSIQSLLRQVDGWKSDMGMVAEDAARRAAAEAMRQVPMQQSSGPETQELQRALGDMQLSQKDAERRTTQTLEAVHDTLKRVVDRLVDMEKDIEAKSVVVAAPVSQAFVSPAPVQETTLQHVVSQPMPAQPVMADQMMMDTGRKPLNIHMDAPVPAQKSAPVVAPPVSAEPAWNSNNAAVDGAAATVAAMRAQRLGVSSPTVVTTPPSKGPISSAIEAARNAVSGIKLPLKAKISAPKETDAPQITQAPANTDGFEKLLEPGSGRPQKGDALSTPEATDPKAKFLAAARQAAQAAAGHAAQALDQGQEKLAGAGKQLGKNKKSTLKTKHALLLGLAALILAVGATLQFTGVPKLIGGAPKQAAPAKEVVGTIDHMRKQIQLSHEKRRTEMQQTAEASNRLPPRQILAEIQEPPLPLPLAKASEVAKAEPKKPASTIASNTAAPAPAAADPVTVGSIGATIQSNIRPPETSVKPALSVSSDPLLQFDGLKDAAGLRAAARNGEVAAFVELGNRFADGKGAQLNPKTAAVWFERAAEQGSAPARYRLGTLYREGKGVDRNPKLALAHFLGAAELGNARAMHNAAVLLAEGVNGAPDYAGAAEWFKNAAEYGIKDSQYNLAILYARGLGVGQDLAASYSWFSAAAKQGDEDSMKKRDEVASRLPADQLKVAKEAAATWKPKRPDVTANEMPAAPSSWDVPTRASTPQSQQKQSRS
jgi:localization factor PodJL